MTSEELLHAKKAYGMHVWHTNGKVDRLGRPVEMRLTFEEWLDIWVKSGHWHERGRKKGQYVMSRVDDLGHYELGNVFIQLHSENVRQWVTTRPSPKKGTHLSEEHKKKLSAALVGRPGPTLGRKMGPHVHPLATCPHCGITCIKPMAVRWHFDNCKHR